MKLVATGELPYALPSIEPLAVLRPQGVKVKNFYTAYQGNIYGLAVPEASAIKTLADLKGKRIGVTAMASGGVPIARAMAASQGLNPDTDIRIVAVGEGGQAAALVRQGAVDVGFVYGSDLVAAKDAGLTALAEYATPGGTVIELAGGVTKGSKNSAEALMFLDYLKSPEAVSVLKVYGFVVQ